MSVLIDSNLLVPLVVGSADVRRIADHRRTSDYTPSDYELLLSTIGGLGGDLVLCPNVVSEASNLLRYDDRAGGHAAALGVIVADAAEHYVPSAAAMLTAAYAWLGVTDAVLLELAGRGGTLLTADAGLYAAAAAAELPVISFAHLRAAV